jgi:hypothetical protein
MAKGTKGPCMLPHKQNGQGPDWSLLFWNFFENDKIIEKSLSSEGEIGFIGIRKLPRLEIGIFRNF